MIRVFTNVQDPFDGGPLEEMFRLRHRVLVQQLQWNGLRSYEGLEIDDYDTPDAIHVVSCDPSDGKVRGCVRFVPSVVPTLSSVVFPQLFNDGPPTGPDIYDVSRIVVDPSIQAPGQPNPVASELFVAWIEAGLALGLDSFTAVVSLNQIKKRVARGWPMMPIGLPHEIDGEDLVGIRVPTTEESLAIAQRSEGIGRSVISMADRDLLSRHHASVVASVGTAKCIAPVPSQSPPKSAAMPLPRHSFDDDHQDISRSLEAAGCVVIEGSPDALNVAVLRQKVEERLSTTPHGEGGFVGRKTKRLGSIIRRYKASHALALNPAVLECIGSALLPNCARYQLHITQAIEVLPGETQQVVHRDSAMYPHLNIDGEVMVNAMWAVSDFTFENGATRVVPGSHKWPEDREPLDEEIVCAELEPGSVLLYLGSTLHCAGGNTTNRSRIGLVMGYSLGWLRQYENQFLAVPPDVARDLPPDLAALIGYASHRPNLGLYECRDPMDFLKEGLPDSAAAQDVLDPATQEILDGLLAAS